MAYDVQENQIRIREQGGALPPQWDMGHVSLPFWLYPDEPPNPWGPGGLDPGFEHPKFPIPGGGIRPVDIMGGGAYTDPSLGTGNPIGAATVGLGLMERMCNIPNEIQPAIPPGGLFGPDFPMPWGQLPGYIPPDDWTSPEPIPGAVEIVSPYNGKLPKRFPASPFKSRVSDIAFPHVSQGRLERRDSPACAFSLLSHRFRF